MTVASLELPPTGRSSPGCRKCAVNLVDGLNQVPQDTDGRAQIMAAAYHGAGCAEVSMSHSRDEFTARFPVSSLRETSRSGFDSRSSDVALPATSGFRLSDQAEQSSAAGLREVQPAGRPESESCDNISIARCRSASVSTPGPGNSQACST